MRQSLPDCEEAFKYLPLRQQGRLAYHLTRPYERLGQMRRALVLAEQALEVFQNAGNVRSVAATQNTLADLLMQQGKIEEALFLNQQALRMYQDLEDGRGVSATQYTLANLLVRQDKGEEALSLYQQALHTYQELGDVRGVAVTETSFSQVLFMHGEQEQGLSLAWKAYQSFQTNGYILDADATQRILLWMKAADPSRFDSLWIQVIQEAQPEWLRIAQENVFQRQGALAAEAVQAVREYVNADSWEEARQVLIARQAVLFAPEIEAFFERNIRSALADDEQRAANILKVHLALLQACKAQGIEMAFAAFMQAIQSPFDATLIPQSIAALRGDPAEKMAHVQYLSEQATQTTDEGTRELIKVIQLALFGGDMSQLGLQLEGVYRLMWERIVAGVNGE